jgi:glycerol-3-phosphate dehydrogenase
MIHGSATVLAKGRSARRLWQRCGGDSRIDAQTEPEWAGKVHPKLDLTCAEVIFHTRHEMARTMGDVLARRSRSLLFDAQASMSAAPCVAAIMALNSAGMPKRPHIRWSAFRSWRVRIHS